MYRGLLHASLHSLPFSSQNFHGPASIPNAGEKLKTLCRWVYLVPRYITRTYPLSPNLKYLWLRALIPSPDEILQICADGCILYRDTLHAPTPSYPNISSKLNICDSAPWSQALMKCWHSVPMDVFRTEKYYTHHPFLNPLLLIKVVKWSSKSSYLLVKITKLCIKWFLF